MENEVEVKTEFSLPNKKVKVRLVNAPRGMVKDSDHAMFNLAPGTTIDICPRNKQGTAIVDCPLNDEEIRFFEDKLKSGMSFGVGELSPYNKDGDNYWRTKRARVRMDNRVKELDLSKPEDYLQYKILLSNTDWIAPSADKEFAKKSYIFVITSDDETRKQVAKRGDKQKRAWRIAGKIENDKQTMLNYLSIAGKRPSESSPIEFLMSEIAKEVETNIDEFLDIMEDKQFDTRVLLVQSLQTKSITKKNHAYFLADGDKLCFKGEVGNLKNTLTYLDAPENQDIRLALEARLGK